MPSFIYEKRYSFQPIQNDDKRHNVNVPLLTALHVVIRSDTFYTDCLMLLKYGDVGGVRPGLDVIVEAYKL
ncbi:hypothetical protein DERF_007253 [Dermatophagoides farinae]|uniref:Uncharacterized protein n=1 Tax=Dermatophagoides farinae TaxID=6954 RepID=A0A922I0Y2_DERFA|nr:hypothetical protein DERF_007253 [Dermatophagoides farinae]